MFDTPSCHEKYQSWDTFIVPYILESLFNERNKPRSIHKNNFQNSHCCIMKHKSDNFSMYWNQLFLFLSYMFIGTSSTSDSCIISSGALIAQPGVSRAFRQLGLIPCTLYTVQEHIARTPSKVMMYQSRSSSVVKLATHNPGIIVVPKIIAYHSPHQVMIDLHIAFPAVEASNKMNCNISNNLGSLQRMIRQPQ